MWKAVAGYLDGMGLIVTCGSRAEAEAERERIKLGDAKRVAITRHPDPEYVLRTEWGCTSFVRRSI